MTHRLSRGGMSFGACSQKHRSPLSSLSGLKARAMCQLDPALAACLLVYESDNVLLGTARLPHRGSFKREAMQVASLDHAMWFHRPVDLNQWLLYAIDTPSTSQARGYTRGHIFTEQGELVASTVQEGLIRLH